MNKNLTFCRTIVESLYIHSYFFKNLLNVIQIIVSPTKQWFWFNSRGKGSVQFPYCDTNEEDIASLRLLLQTLQAPNEAHPLL